MSKMSEIHMLVTDQIEEGKSFDEIAYSLTCEYSLDFASALSMVESVAKSIDYIASKM